MNSKSFISVVDGEFVKANQPVIESTSRGLMYGDGCFETFCTYATRFFNLSKHLNRLKNGLAYLQIDYPDALQAQKLKSLIGKLLSENNLQDKNAIIRLQVWREGERGYGSPSRDFHYSIVCSQKKLSLSEYRLATVAAKRIPSAALPSAYKFTNGINYITAARQARQQGANDALMETINGFVSETTIANIFWLRNNVVFTPEESCDILPGITRQVVMIILNSMPDLEVQEDQFKIADVKNAEAVWVCNSVKEILPVCQIDQVQFDTQHPIVEKIRTSFRNYLKANLER